VQREAAAADALEADPAAGGGQTLAQHQQPRLEVVVAGGQPEALVEAQLAVGERRAPARRVLLEQLPQDPPGHAADQVLAADEDAVVGLVVLDRQRLAGRRRLGLRRAVGALAPVGLEQRERRRQMAPQDAQQALGLRPEAAGLLALEVEHAGHAAAHDERDGGGALGARQPRQRDRARRQRRALPDRLAHRARAGEARHADDLAALGGDADQADPRGHLRAGGRGGVAVARHAEQAAVLVGGEQDRVAEAEQVVERLERRARRLGVLVALPDAAHELVERREHVAHRRGRLGRREVAVDGDAAQHPVHVDAAQAEHVGHPLLRRDRVEVDLHLIEDPPLGLGVQVLEVERVLLHRRRIDQAQLPERVGVEVRAGLVEELAREADPLGVDQVHDRHVGDVRRPVGRARRERRGDQALEARGRDRLEREAHSRAPPAGPASGRRARAPRT
jgi:hypothetical protein